MSTAEPLIVPVPGGAIHATRRGSGPPVLLLHGGPGLGAEYLDGLVDELDRLIDGVLAQQRGLEPSTVEGPRDVERHVADQVAVLDQLGWDRAWLIGHAWGAHLGMHLAVAHPERVAGLISIEAIGAVPDGGSGALVPTLVARLTPDERGVLDTLIAQRGDGSNPGIEALIISALWPSYFHDHATAARARLMRIEVTPPGESDTMTSVRAHFAAGTLERGLPSFDRPALFLHGVSDPLPASASVDSAALIPGARVELIEASGHFPWLERPGVVRAAVGTLLRESSARD